MLELLITADDRTGALETGGACADLGFEVRLTTAPDTSDDCAVVDLDSRHCTADEASRRIGAVHRVDARFRCHKMDSGLRGNWPREVAALIALGRRVGILASFPDAGRRCDAGTVYIRDVPVAESPFGRDPRNRLLSSRPLDYLRGAGCGNALADGSLVVLDANTNEELSAAAARCREEDRMLVGTTGGVAAYVATLRSRRGAAVPVLPRPALIVCGSLHPLSRTQVSRLACLTVGPDEAEQAVPALQRGADVVLATEATSAGISDSEAEGMASAIASAVWDWIAAAGVQTVIILGGDTAAAVLGDRTLRVLGSADTAVPFCRTEDRRLTVVTKGGGIGEEDTLARLLDPANA